MPGLILEGGTFRPVFSCGVMDALLDLDLHFDYVSGVSAGITNGISYVTGQRGRNLETLRRYRSDPRYLGARNLPRSHSLFGLDFVFDTLANDLLPLDRAALAAFPGRVLVGVTNALTGQCEYLDGKALDHPCTMLRATCALPIYFPPIFIGQTPYFDGGIADSIPLAQSIRDGNRKNLVVLTQPAGFRKTLSAEAKLGAALYRHRYPNLYASMLSRPKRYNDTLCLCRHLEQKTPQNIVVLRPSYKLDSFEKDIPTLEKSYQMGYDMTMEKKDAIAALFQ